MPLKCLVDIGEGTLNEDELRPAAHAFVMELVGGYLDQGRNVTCDNFFTSRGLIEELLHRNTTYVGTARRNIRDLPAKYKNLAGRTRGDSRHYYRENMTLCSYWDKQCRPVLLLSSMHTSTGPLRNTQSREESEPEMVL